MLGVAGGGEGVTRGRVPERQRRQSNSLRAEMERFEADAAGQRRTAAALEALPSGWTVVHGLAVPGVDAKVEHLVVGPPGVFAIDSQTYNTKFPVKAGEGTLLRGRWSLRFEMDQVKDQSAALSHSLGTPVSPVFCLVRDNLEPSPTVVGGLTAVNRSTLVDWLLAQPDRLDAAAVAALAAAATATGPARSARHGGPARHGRNAANPARSGGPRLALVPPPAAAPPAITAPPAIAAPPAITAPTLPELAAPARSVAAPAVVATTSTAPAVPPASAGPVVVAAWAAPTAGTADVTGASVVHGAPALGPVPVDPATSTGRRARRGAVLSAVGGLAAAVAVSVVAASLVGGGRAGPGSGTASAAPELAVLAGRVERALPPLTAAPAPAPELQRAAGSGVETPSASVEFRCPARGSGWDLRLHWPARPADVTELQWAWRTPGQDAWNPGESWPRQRAEAAMLHGLRASEVTEIRVVAATPTGESLPATATVAAPSTGC